MASASALVKTLRFKSDTRSRWQADRLSAVLSNFAQARTMRPFAVLACMALLQPVGSQMRTAEELATRGHQKGEITISYCMS